MKMSNCLYYYNQGGINKKPVNKQINKLNLLKEKYKMAMMVKEYDRAKKYLKEIKKIEENE